MKGLLGRGEFISVEAPAESRSIRRSIMLSAAEVFNPEKAGGQERAAVESKQACIHAERESRSFILCREAVLRTLSKAWKGRRRLMSRCDWMPYLP